MDGLPLVREALPRTVRLVASARLRDAVLAPLVDSNDELALLAEIEGATSGRLVSEERGKGSLTAAELVHGVPHAKFINASFAYAKPREPNRFNPAERGAWYAALAVETCVAEVGHHLTSALADAGDFHAVVKYSEMLSSMAGVFVDLRQAPDHRCLDPNPAVGYPAGNAVAAATRGGWPQRGHLPLGQESRRHLYSRALAERRPVGGAGCDVPAELVRNSDLYGFCSLTGTPSVSENDSYRT